ncbi:capsid cement protein [Nonomuraea sp. SYSU D8015]|uniref:capsid cement protein n=1 Tax=Nonomuraea sp. SYSU D8015 TaxID=2593644 RepID=UPI0016613DFC|nr:capsid cement protein [Nonomuraea sp. SYSU D8015]
MADYTPVYYGGAEPFAMTASAAITGGQVVHASGVGTVAPTAGASGSVVGVAAFDAASGTRVTVWPISGVMHETTTPAGVTAGAALASAASGGVDSGTLGTLAAAGHLIGTAVSTATAGNKCRWIGR